jgi:hypothetical protein
VAKLLVGVVETADSEHFSRLLGKGVLVLHLDLGLEALFVPLLGGHPRLGQQVLLVLVLGLVGHLRVQDVAGLRAEATALGQVAGRVRAWLVVDERVRVGWLRSESCGGHQL